MKKNICFYSLIFLVATSIFSILLPYPILSRYTNSTESQVSKANNFKETELSQIEPTNNLILDITWDEGINNLIELNQPYELYDISSGQYFSVIRIGGNLHADVIPVTQEDFDFINGNFADKTCSPVVLVYNSSTLIPASLSPYMHGYSDINGMYYGHMCLHFKNSKNHASGDLDTFHQKAIKEARKKASTIFDE